MRIRVSLAAFFVLFFSAAFVMGAQPGEEARNVLSAAVNSILDDIRSPMFANPATRKQETAKIEKTVRTVFDFGEFSSRTVGPRWKTFSAGEKKRFSDAFADLLFTTYLNKITGYNGEQVSYTGEIVSSNGKRVEVKTVIALSDGRKTPVNYRMLPKDGSWRVYDVIIENISLVKNYRTQFQDILNTATPDQLISRVMDRAKELEAQSAANGK